MEIFEDARVVSRADLAAWLRQLAGQLESGQLFYGAAGAVAVADQLHCELEIERESGSEMSVEIEFTWTSPEVAESVAASGEGGTADEEDEKEDRKEVEQPESEISTPAMEAAAAGDSGGDATAVKDASVTEGTPDTNAQPTAEV